MRLHKIWVEKISLFRLKKCACQLLLTITCSVSSSTSSTCALRCIISVYCINHSLDKTQYFSVKS